HTVLTLIAFHDLLELSNSCRGSVAQSVEALCRMNDGEGWFLPERVRLADYGLGRDERALRPQPVREYFGPRFAAWQQAQTQEEFVRECHLHARNLLGRDGYGRLLSEIRGELPSAGSETRTLLDFGLGATSDRPR